jgi:hypothetical protein
MLSPISSIAELNEREIRIVQMRAAGKSTTEIAVAIGRGVHIVYSALRKPSIKAAIAELTAGALQPHYELTCGELGNSILRLVAVRDAEATSDANRIKAAVAIADLCLALHKAVKVLPRLAVAEEQLDRIRNRETDDDALAEEAEQLGEEG